MGNGSSGMPERALSGRWLLQGVELQQQHTQNSNKNNNDDNEKINDDDDDNDDVNIHLYTC